MTREEDLAALWSAAAPADDARDLARLAGRTPWLARLMQWGDLLAVAALAVTISLSIVTHIAPATVLTGGLVLLLLAWTAWKRHHLRNIALLIDDRDRLSFIRSLVRAKRADVDRSAIGLAFVLPGALITLLMAFAMRVPDGEGGAAAFLAAVLTTPRALLTLGFLFCGLTIFVLSHIRLIRELERLRRVQREYEDEERSDQFAQS